MVKGSCLCGQICFTVDGALSDMTHCHCSMCRKIHGSLFATYLAVSDFHYTSDTEQIQTYQSSKGFTRAFCKCCGSVLPESNTEDSSYIPAGLLDDDPGIRPAAHIFVESKSDYYEIHDNLPQHVHYGDGDDSRVVDIAPVVDKTNQVSGGCLCGDVAFTYTGSPKFVMNCHCSRCRKVKGAAHATNAFVPVDQFKWLRGESNVTNYDLPQAERFGHCFCARCGSSQPRESPGTGMFNIPVGSLNSAPGKAARGHIYTDSKAPWFEIADDLPAWAEMPN